MNTSTFKLNVLLKRTQLIIHRLEKLSPDSTWAHSASGYRGALIRVRDRIDNQPPADNLETLTNQLMHLNDVSFDLLVEAGIELIN